MSQKNFREIDLMRWIQKKTNTTLKENYWRKARHTSWYVYFSNVSHKLWWKGFWSTRRSSIWNLGLNWQFSFYFRSWQKSTIKSFTGMNNYAPDYLLDPRRSFSDTLVHFHTKSWREEESMKRFSSMDDSLSIERRSER
jgi:hypothetical protein